MKTLSYTQGVAATHIDDEQRVAWAKQGLYILQRGGKRKWVAALNARHVEQAKQQYAAFLERQA